MAIQLVILVGGDHIGSPVLRDRPCRAITASVCIRFDKARVAIRTGADIDPLFFSGLVGRDRVGGAYPVIRDRLAIELAIFVPGMRGKLAVGKIIGLLARLFSIRIKFLSFYPAIVLVPGKQ